MSGGLIWSEAGAGQVFVPAFTYVEFSYNELPTNVELVMAMVVNGEVLELSWKPLVIGEQALIEQAMGAAWSIPVFNKYLPYVDVMMSARVVDIQQPVSETLVVVARPEVGPIPDDQISVIKDGWEKQKRKLADVD